jgi:DHA2 family multidrug resistance protein
MLAANAIEDRALLHVENRWLLLIGVILVSICQFLDATIANIALPHMQATLGASTETISWVLTSYIIATAIATPITGWLSDRVGSRNLFLASTGMFLAASAACGAATSLEQMVLFRVFQGVAAGFIGPMTMTIMFDVSPPSKQPMTLAIFSIIVMVAPISGPTIGGFIVENLNWRWIFYVNLPFGIPAVVLLWWLLPSRAIDRRPLDLFGFAMISLALASSQLVFDRGQNKDWFNSWEIIVELLVALCAFAVFVLHSSETRTPLFRRELWTNSNFVISLGFMAVMGVAVVGLSSVLPMMFQTIYGYPVIDTGLLMAPRGIGVMITSLLAGQVIKRIDSRYVMATGYLIAAFGMWSMTSWSIVMDAQPILLAAFIQGLGFGLVVAPMNLMAFATLPPSLRPDGSSLMALFRSLGGSIGISVVVTMLNRNQHVSYADLAAHITATSPAMDLAGTTDRLAESETGMLAAINAQVSRQSLMIAFLDDFYMLSWVLLAFVPLPLLLKKPRLTGSEQIISAIE